LEFIGSKLLDINNPKFISENFQSIGAKRKEVKTRLCIIGYWQVNRKNNFSIEKLIEFNLYYEENKNLKIMIEII